MKNIRYFILAALISLLAIVPSFAGSPLIIDKAKIISKDAKESLTTKAEDIRKKYNFDVAIVTVSSTEGYTPKEYSEAIYKQLSYGQGASKDGMMLLISMEERDFDLFKNGRISDNLPNSLEDSILEATKSKLKNDDFDGAFDTFLSKVDEVYSNEKPDGTFPKEPKGIFPYIIGIVGSFIVALIIVQVGAGSLKSVRFSRTANSYIRQNSMVINEGFDRFLYRNVTRREKPKSNSSSSNGNTRSSGSSPHSSHTSGKF